MDSDQGKLFIGGISWETSEEKMKEHFQGYGDVVQTVVMRDKITGKPRGFGFVVFADPSVIDRVLQDTHVIDGRTVEAKRALSREEQQGPKSGNMGGGRSFGGSGNTRTKKIFVGGLPPTLTEDDFRIYFETYGNVTDVAIMYDQQTNRPRGFGFISFDSEDAVDRVLHKAYHDLSGKQVEVKRALPKDSNSGFGGRSTGNGGSGMGGGSYQGYGDNPSSYDRMDTNRYMQSQNTGGGYPSYGSSGYGTAGYGYGSSNNGMGYGAYGSYGGANPGYGGVNPGYGGAAGAAFGNPNVPGAGYGSGQAGGPRSSWGSQVSSGYGNMGYGNVSWGASSGGGGGGPANGGSAAGQSPTGATGYGNQGYGYGGYGGNDGSYGGGASGDMQSGGGYMGSGYGDASGNSQGSGNYGAQQNGPYGGGAPSRRLNNTDHSGQFHPRTHLST